MSRIVVAGSFDSKAEPLGRLVADLRDLGEHPIVIDTGVYPGERGCTFSSDQVAAQADLKIENVAALGRAEAVRRMAEGAAAILRKLAAQGDVGGLVCMGGSNAAAVFAQLAAVLPMGVPKILMATMVAGDTRSFVGARDVILLYPVVDVEGDNSILRTMIARTAATAVAVKSAIPLSRQARTKKAVALSMYGVTTPCVQAVRRGLEAKGIDAYVFHANGSGGRSIEAFAADGLVDGVADLTIAELCHEVLGGALSAGPDRFATASRVGIVQVISPGALDMVTFGPPETVPERLRSRKTHPHNALVTLARTSAEECRAVARLLAHRLGKPKAATMVCIPLGGVSMLDREGQPFHDPSAIRAFASELRAIANPAVEIVESGAHINDPEFASLVQEKLLDALAASSVHRANGESSQ
jgi:uncharacterized protein (UPF0261 family)